MATTACAGGASSPPVQPVVLPAPAAGDASLVVAPPADVTDAGAPPPQPEAGATPVATLACTCGAPGEVTQDLVEAVQRSVTRTRRCYEPLLVDDPALQGTLRVDLVVGADGSACKATLVSTTLPEKVGTCVADALLHAAYAPPRSGCVTLGVPVRFVPRSGPADAAAP